MKAKPRLYASIQHPESKRRAAAIHKAMRQAIRDKAGLPPLPPALADALLPPAPNGQPESPSTADRQYAAQLAETEREQQEELEQLRARTAFDLIKAAILEDFADSNDHPLPDPDDDADNYLLDGIRRLKVDMLAGDVAGVEEAMWWIFSATGGLDFRDYLPDHLRSDVDMTDASDIWSCSQCTADNAATDPRCTVCDSECPSNSAMPSADTPRDQLSTELDRVAALSTLSHTNHSTNLLRYLEPSDNHLVDDEPEESPPAVEMQSQESVHVSQSDKGTQESAGVQADTTTPPQPAGPDAEAPPAADPTAAQRLVDELKSIIRPELATLQKDWTPRPVSVYHPHIPASATAYCPLLDTSDPDGAAYCRQLASEFKSVSERSLAKQCRRWLRKGMSPDILPRYLLMICEIMTDNPTFDYKRLMGTSGSLNSPMMVVMHFGTAHTNNDPNYSMTLDKASPFPRLVHEKIGLNP
ncbi:hypothetical protein PRZ48_007932 [Zasmidium cellare]|uniref:RanBP2-type domain-containing protein n=1 Tax=Zasmidium cellare TaxID=395010 RepID=A0ABR0EER4_ZASCE|nr:hypothetical protein PRZ48_007932 [Zasmidium cellare]